MTLIRENPDGLYDSADPGSRHRVNLKGPLLDDDGDEIPIYGKNGAKVSRMSMVVRNDQPACGVLVNLKDIQTLFNPDISSMDIDEDQSSSPYEDDPFVRVEAYPLGFLKMEGNVKAAGVPYCFYPVIADINSNVTKNHPIGDPAGEAGEDLGEDNESDQDSLYSPPIYRAVKPVSSQMYNYIAHRVASGAGRHDSQQGSVTAAISGAFAKTPKDEKTARRKQRYCQVALPSERFHDKINSVTDCPSCCRAELVYSIDVRALENPSGR